MTINLNGRIDSELFNQFLQAVNTLSDGEPLNIYLCSAGGDYEVMEAFLDYINWNASGITIHGYGRIFSCAFDLFFLAECKKRLIGEVVGQYHMASSEVTMSEVWTPVYPSDAVKKEYHKRLHIRTMELCETLEFSPAEIKKIKACHDLYFTSERMRKFLSKV